MFDIGSFYEAKDVKDAIAALKADKNAEIISGGTDVLIRVREGRDAGRALVSIHNIKEIKGVRKEPDGSIIIGAGTAFSHITNDETVKKYINVLGEAVDTVGGPQIRNVGTVGGNVCNGATSADSAATLLSYDAAVILEGENGTREVPVRDFYTGPGKTVRERTEVCVGFRIRKEEYEGFEGRYIKYGKRNAMEIATLGCVVRVKLSSDKKTVEEARLAYGVAAPTPVRCLKAEKAIRGMSISDESIYDKFADAALTEVNPRTSWRASKEFRMQLISELCKRALREAVLRSGANEAETAEIPYEPGRKTEGVSEPDKAAGKAEDKANSRDKEAR